MEFSGQRVIELLDDNLFEQDKTKPTLYLRQDISANRQKKEANADDVDALLRICGIDSPTAIEDTLGKQAEG